MKKRILIITTDYPPPMGGVQVFTYDLEQQLKKAGFTVLVLNFDGRNTSTHSTVRLRDFFYTPATRNSHFSLSNILNPFRVFRDTGGFRDFVYKNMIYRLSQQAIREFHPDLIHIMKNELFAAVVNTTVPYVVSCHSSTVDLYDAPHIRYSLEHAAKIHCVSEYVKTLVQGLVTRDSGDILVIPNAIDLTKYQPTNTLRKNRIITIARLTAQKNISTLIKAFALLPVSLQTTWEYIILGSGPEFDRLTALAKQQGAEAIQFLGEIRDERRKIEFLSESKVFLLCPTTYQGSAEAFGIVYLEAEALGVPIICSATGGIPEAVGKGGIYITDEKNVKEIANALQRVLTHSHIASQLVSKSAARINRFDLPIWFASILRMYDAIY